MANTKKNVTDEKIDIAAKAGEIKAETADVVPAEKKSEAPKAAKKRGRPASAKAKTGKASAAMKEKASDAKPEKAAVSKAEKAAAPKSEKTAAAKTEKTPAAKAEKVPAAKNESASKTGKKRGRPAADKTAANAAVKTTGKRGASKKLGSTAPAKRGGRKKALTYENVVDAARKKMASANISRIKYPIAVNIKLLGNINGDFYVLISDGKIDVEPYPYNDKDVKMEINDVESFMAVLNGKKDIYDALADGSVSISDNTKKAILFINAAF